MIKNILISGVNGGIGLATAKRFIDSGNYRVFGFDIQDEAILTGVEYYKCDITDDNRIHEVYDDISKRIDVLHSLISLAGVYYMDSLLEIDNERREIPTT